jgi:hypothetical protein
MGHITPHIDLLAMIEAHRAKSGVSETAFGVFAVGDPNFVRNLKEGREPRRKTVQRVVDFILTGQTHHKLRGQE